MLEQYTALLVWATLNISLILWGINGFKRTRLVPYSEWPDYLEATGWAWFGIFGMTRLAYVVCCDFDSFERTLNQGWWLGFLLTAPFIVFMTVRSYTSLRRYRTLTREQREAVASLNRKASRLDQELKKTDA